jgi:hypothetical protein
MASSHSIQATKRRAAKADNMLGLAKQVALACDQFLISRQIAPEPPAPNLEPPDAEKQAHQSEI